MDPSERATIAGLSRADWHQVLRDIPAALVFFLAFVGWCALMIAVLGEPVA